MIARAELSTPPHAFQLSTLDLRVLAPSVPKLGRRALSQRRAAQLEQALVDQKSLSPNLALSILHGQNEATLVALEHIQRGWIGRLTQRTLSHTPAQAIMDNRIGANTVRKHLEARYLGKQSPYRSFEMWMSNVFAKPNWQERTPKADTHQWLTIVSKLISSYRRALTFESEDIRVGNATRHRLDELRRLMDVEEELFVHVAAGKPSYELVALLAQAMESKERSVPYMIGLIRHTPDELAGRRRRDFATAAMWGVAVPVAGVFVLALGARQQHLQTIDASWQASPQRPAIAGELRPVASQQEEVFFPLPREVVVDPTSYHPSRIVIPSIGFDQPIVTIRDIPATIYETPGYLISGGRRRLHDVVMWPETMGIPGVKDSVENIGIFAHSRRLNDQEQPIQALGRRWYSVKEGDEISLYDQAGRTYEYEVIAVRRGVSSGDTSHLQQTTTDVLTLETCQVDEATPGAGRLRDGETLIVHAVRKQGIG